MQSGLSFNGYVDPDDVSSEEDADDYGHEQDDGAEIPSVLMDVINQFLP